jgi:hypothetical protein
VFENFRLNFHRFSSHQNSHHEFPPRIPTNPTQDGLSIRQWGVTSQFAKLGTYLYYFDGCYRRNSYCEMAKQVENANVLLLAGLDAAAYQESGSRLSKCFAATTQVETRLDLSPSGFSIINASMVSPRPMINE